MDDGGGEDRGDKRLNWLPRRRIKRDQNINVGSRAGFNKRAECPSARQRILDISALELDQELSSIFELGLIRLPFPFFCQADFMHDVGHGTSGILRPHRSKA